MKKLLNVCMIAMILAITGCERQADVPLTDSSPDTQVESEPVGESESADEEDDMLNFEIIIGNDVFSAVLYDNEAAREFRTMLPMTFDMSELNGNEKYYYLSESLPVDADIPNSIKEGDLMLYGSNCVVLFYDSFSTSYSYTPLGRIDEPDGLAAALGSGSVQVTFK